MPKIFPFVLIVSLFFFEISFANELGSNGWSYQGATGPEHWGDLKQQYLECKTGQMQSPIDIERNITEQLSLIPISTHYLNSMAKIDNTGSTMEIDLQDGGKVTLPSGVYKLKQIHFHSPSEQKIDGRSFPLEAHLVHKSETGNLAVIAILFELGKENMVLKSIFSNFPKQIGGQFITKFDASALVKKNKAYFNYLGSLTTPPCSEGVDWYVLKDHDTLSVKQIEEFQKHYFQNNRPIQQTNGRLIKEFK